MILAQFPTCLAVVRASGDLALQLQILPVSGTQACESYFRILYRTRARSTTLGIARAKQRADNKIPSNVGDFTKRVDGALPGKHTRQLYDQLTWKEANVLAQLRTGMARLNDYLYRIKATTSQQCACGHARETVDHFLFLCTRWTAFRTEMIQCTNTQRGNISFYLGGKQRSDNENWAPNMEAVRATIRNALATGRLENTRH
ncbi:reverse transcriptase [Purpureocillium lilacinum]|uniref:Reverse transcriptase n=1 Tax=Purpureocillium lilacinum TaxID=33203 RepID=A0A179FEM5_PURLI|nr:reverse transcriptase [Purpureocillium lilacinum]